MNIIEKIGVLDTYNVDNCSKIRDNKNRIQKMKKTEKISGSKKIYSSPLGHQKITFHPSNNVLYFIVMIDFQGG